MYNSAGLNGTVRCARRLPCIACRVSRQPIVLLQPSFGSAFANVNTSTLVSSHSQIGLACIINNEN